MKPLSEITKDLFGNDRRFVADPKGAKPLNERAELIDFFVKQQFKYKNGKVLDVVAVAVRMAHYKTRDLYAIKSAFLDRKDRNGETTARKWWWWITDTKVVNGTDPRNRSEATRAF